MRLRVFCKTDMGASSVAIVVLSPQSKCICLSGLLHYWPAPPAKPLPQLTRADHALRQYFPLFFSGHKETLGALRAKS